MGQIFSRSRRMLLAAGAGLGCTFMGAGTQVRAQRSVGVVQDLYVPRAKYALVIGNGNYPNRKDLPPARKNVQDIEEVLRFLDFDVTSHFDVGFDSMREVLGVFSAKMREVEANSMRGSVATVFYFCGHGFQFTGQNYLVPAGVDPSADGAIKQSFRLIEDVMATLPQRYPGVSLALIDACRTDPNVKRGVDDFNQVAAPDGTLLFFATRAGRPALAPIDQNRNTFFTAAVVKAFRSANGVTPIDDLCQRIAVDCRDSVQREFQAKKISLSPQFPESSVNLRGKFVIRNRDLELNRQRRREEIEVKPDVGQMEDRWQSIQAELKPRSLLSMVEAFVKDFPASEYAETAQVIFAGVRSALDAQRAANLSSDVLIDQAGNADYRDALAKALRGDKDAAHRVALMYRSGSNGIMRNERRTEQWLRFAAEVGNGIASWQLAEIYSASSQQADAAKYERRAIELGYRPPPRLSNRGY